MQSVTFVFRPGLTSTQQESILDKVGAWKSVHKATRLNAASHHPDISRMAYAYINEEAEAENVVKQLSEMPEIESASLPAKRSLKV
jgi:hypothetical protein